MDRSNSRVAGLFIASNLAISFPASAASFAILHAFRGEANGNDGANPAAALIEVAGALYGTTFGGGDYGRGAVFELGLGGLEKVVFSLGGSNGGGPDASLLNYNGALYGSAVAGGNSTYGYGTVFSITTTGLQRGIYSFQGGGDGGVPQANLINVGGMLYGTTSRGGTALDGSTGYGTVFYLNQGGNPAVTTVYSFSNLGDGAYPLAGLTNIGGALFGTTSGGNGSGGSGNVFKLSTAGVETVLHSFRGGSDGANPQAALIAVRGDLYGTTAFGGKFGYGTVFKVTQAGVETVLHSFSGGSDGANPVATLIDVGGVLYGTTEYGGPSNCGTIFKIGLGGLETVVYSFQGFGDGCNPKAGLINVRGVLYGTAYNGGYGSGIGSGIVFKLKP